MRTRALFCISFFLLAGCGGCEDEPAPVGDDTVGGDIVLDSTDGTSASDGDASMADMGRVVDAADVDRSDDGDGMMSDADGSSVQCKNVDTWTNRQHCGSCGNACTGEEICNNGSCKCPDYHTSCGGKCVATNLNPDHCGSCMNKCMGSEVCNGGRCVTDCPTGMTACTDQNKCVDTSTDDANCGSCGNACPSGKSCSYGKCVDAVQVGQPPAKCAGGGPPINVGFTQNNMQKKCSGKVAKTTFKWGLCSCDRVQFGQEFVVDAYDSSKGPYTQHGFGGGVGSNGSISVGKGEIWGALWTSSPQGVDGDVELTVKQQVHSQGDYSLATNGSVGGESWIGGNITADRPGGPSYNFDKTVHIPSGNSIHRRAQTSSVSRQPVNVSTVCKRCQPGNRIPVRQIVKNHENNNDNGAIGLNDAALINPGKEIALKLPCGKYYLDGVQSGSKVTITATGRTALFIDGNIDVSDIIIQPTPSAQLDVFVNGSVTFQAGNAMKIGSPAYPASMRFYVNKRWTFRNNGTIGAYIYAIPGGITSTMNNLEIFGGVYTQNFQTMNNLRVHYDREVLEADKKCPVPNPDPDPDPDAGMSDSDSGGTEMDSGTSKMDSGGSKMDTGGGGPTCSEAGGSCSSDGDCCSPLVCDSGTCDTSSCQALNETCSSDSECCSGTCARTFNICTGT